MDINLLPIARYSGHDYPELIGLHYTEAPRRSARGREQDRLIFYLVFEGTPPFSNEKREQILLDLSRLYYRTPGSMTAALKASAEAFNRILLERNIQLGANRECIGYLIQILLRGSRLMIAQSGSIQIHKITSEGSVRIDNPELAGRGLGISKSGAIYFYQSNVQPNDVLLLSLKGAPEWTNENLNLVHGQGPETLRRRLFYQTKADINALAVQIKQGNGKFLLIRSAAAHMPDSEKAKTANPSPGSIAPIPSAVDHQHPFRVTLTDSHPTSSIENAAIDRAQEFIDPKSQVDDDYQLAPNTADHSSKKNLEKPAQTEKSKDLFSQLGKTLGGTGRKGVGSLKVFIGRMLPDESLLNISPNLMAFIAVMIPLVVVIAASSVYFRLGRSAQYELLTTQAEQILQQSYQQSDPGTKRADLSASLSLLQKADTFAADSGTKAEIKTQLKEVRNALDELDLVKRVDYQPAIIGGLKLSNKITEIQAVEDQLYLLDSSSSSVLHASLTEKGYEIDNSFQCSSGTYGEVGIDQLVEIIAWPTGYKPQADLLAVDSQGNVLYCKQNQLPTAERLMPGEGEGWGNILDAALDQGDFYALDLSSNSVWIYWRANFSEQPTMFFDEQIPPLQNVVDMLVDRDDLYLLQQDGRLILCARETLVVSPTRCQFQDFIDRRPGRENLVFSPQSPFTKITSTAPPDPSLFLLDSASHTIYHFSLRNLAMQRQFLAEQMLPSSPATAFAVNQERRMLYLAVGSQIFYAVMP